MSLREIIQVECDRHHDLEGVCQICKQHVAVWEGGQWRGHYVYEPRLYCCWSHSHPVEIIQVNGVRN